MFLSEKKEKDSPYFWYLIMAIVLITFCCYSYSIKNQFTNWDDDRFILKNPYIKNLNPDNLKMLLFHDITKDYFNPMTMLSYTLNYYFSGSEPEGYYITNIILHVFNTCLLFYFTLLLLNTMQNNGYGEIKGKQWIAVFCALCFGVHPMHVESVSWAAERKDTLYALFYFAGLITYLRYIGKKDIRWMALTIICCLASILSKPMAVVFVFSLCTIDMILKRDKEKSIASLLLEKSPFFILALCSLVSTYILQRSSGAIMEHSPFTFSQRFLFASYGFITYIYKAVIPVNLCSFYPYPSNPGGGFLPVIFYLAPFLAAGLLLLSLYYSFRAGENNFRIVLFGFSFFIFNIGMVLQLIPSGPNIIAERYTYICYLGLFFIPGFYMSKVFGMKTIPRNFILAGIFLYIATLAFLCYQRTKVWHNSGTLWTDVIEKYPLSTEKAYINLGDYYFENGDTVNAWHCYKIAVDMKTEDPIVYSNVANMMAVKKDYNQSLFYYDEAIKLSAGNRIDSAILAETYTDRGVTYSAMGNFRLAFMDYEQALKLNPLSETLLKNIAYSYLNSNHFDDAVLWYSRVIRINPQYAGYYYNRGIAEFDKGNISEALEDFKKTNAMEPEDAENIFYMSIAYSRLNDFDNALKFALSSKKKRYNVPEGYIGMLNDKIQQGGKQE